MELIELYSSLIKGHYNKNMNREINLTFLETKFGDVICGVVKNYFLNYINHLLFRGSMHNKFDNSYHFRVFLKTLNLKEIEQFFILFISRIDSKTI